VLLGRWYLRLRNADKRTGDDERRDEQRQPSHEGSIDNAEG
jgi:hypothetical protein